ncbi:MAG: phosphate uptake regulator PhoU [Desulfurococcales archaeon]|nr:phosphate uptake regulator PhoU [Desulfurococcales archaeon]
MAVQRRRVQVTGRSTFIVSLPKDWALAWGLKPGSEVLLEKMPDGSLLVRPQADASRREAGRVIRVTGESLNLLVTEVLAAYLAGYNRIEVEYRDADPRVVAALVEEARKRALGLEVLEEDYGRIVLYTLAGPPTISIGKAFERMVGVTRSMLANLSQALRRGDEAILESIIERDTVVDKFFLLIMRQLSMLLQGELAPSDAGVVSLPEILYKVIAAKSIERVADHAVMISSILKETRREAVVSDDLVELYESARGIFDHSARAFLEMDRASAYKAITLTDTFKAAEEKARASILATAYLPDATAILDSIRRIAAYSRDLVEATINVIELREAAKAALAKQ